MIILVKRDDLRTGTKANAHYGRLRGAPQTLIQLYFLQNPVSEAASGFKGADSPVVDAWALRSYVSYFLSMSCS